MHMPMYCVVLHTVTTNQLAAQIFFLEGTRHHHAVDHFQQRMPQAVNADYASQPAVRKLCAMFLTLGSKTNCDEDSILL